jgi:hypothetical protein
LKAKKIKQLLIPITAHINKDQTKIQRILDQSLKTFSPVVNLYKISEALVETVEGRNLNTPLKNLNVGSVLTSRKIRVKSKAIFKIKVIFPALLTQSGKWENNKVIHRMKRRENPSKTLSTTIVAKAALLEISAFSPKE